MKQKISYGAGLIASGCIFLATTCPAQQSFTWDQVKAKFEAVNPALKADADNVDEMKAQEITANLRPNPQFSTTVDGTQIAPNNGHWVPLAGTFVEPSVSYLHERDHKRELRLKSAQQGTRISESEHEDL
jgi:cobalt-zinc-cadmium efflux system outer membrane protein